ncbi:hypothetical protein TNIN_421841 [Trichonephila inaurata madagascariensis]|uniref:Uncharacterized protein n=1 Tax=Trichonephila inaurata madagascariensis TaxID=2747483 RepID=A0A8X6XQ09_9ARAC|nr:hypothetical protein TNIN_421841 [Trichonephila inaurata madagascariensis]
MAPICLERSRDKGLSKHLVYDPPRFPFHFEVTCHRPLRRQSPKTNKVSSIVLSVTSASTVQKPNKGK